MFKQLKTGVNGILFSVLLVAQTLSAQAAENPTVNIETTMGGIVVELYSEQAPITVKNFLAYVNDGFYDGTIFHRVINNFMIQGGGYTKEFYEDQNKEKTTRAAIKNESDNGLSNVIGTVAMARTGDPDSATAQFFISVKDNSYLDFQPNRPGYAVFAKVIDGMDVVMTISKVATRKLGPTPDVPEEPVIITKMRAN